jgi:hypothetical protein
MQISIDATLGVADTVAFMHGRPRYFRSSDDRKWAEWLGASGRSRRDLVSILGNTTVPQWQKARALMVLLSPQTEWLPILWTGGTNTLVKDADWLSEVPDSMVRLCADMVRCFMDLVRKSYGQMGGEAGDRQGTTRLGILNDYIPHLLPRMKPKPGLQLLRYYELLHPMVAAEGNLPTGYWPFIRLMSNADMPVAYQEQADAVMRLVVSSERLGLTTPRTTPESALYWYHKMLLIVSQDRPAYPHQLFASQLEFLVSESSDRADFNFPWQTVERLLVLLGGQVPPGASELDTMLAEWIGPGHLGLRRQLIRYVLRPCKDRMRFQLDTPESVLLAIRMSQELGQEEPALTNRLTELITEARQPQGQVAC